MTTAFEQILYEVDDPVATITLNRPDQLNAWTARMGHEVAAALGEAERDPAVVGIVITGAGRGLVRRGRPRDARRGHRSRR